MTNDSTTTTSDSIEAIKTKAVAAAKKRKAKAKPKAKAKAKSKSKGKAKAIATRADSKQARFIAAMRTARGISIDEAAKEFDWQKHTVRGAVAGALKKKLGLKVESAQDDKRGTVYRIK